MVHHLKSGSDGMVVLDVSPQSAGWEYLSYRVVELGAGEVYMHSADGCELALVPLEGAGVVRAGGADYRMSRTGVFSEKPEVLYLPPGHDMAVTTENAFAFALGTAPAEGKYPPRLFRREEIRSEVRGGGSALRQVNHVLSHPMPAERLILFEVYVPGGAWSGYPPHCHDGYGGSAHLDETYYFRVDPPSGVALHRNYRRDREMEEIFAVRDRDLVLVTEGFHCTAAAPGSNVYFLNYLAGELMDDARGTPPYDDPDYVWLKEDYGANAMSLPLDFAR